MKYTNEQTAKLIADYKLKIPVAEIAAALDVPTRSVIAKLSSLGVYEKKKYVTKRGEVPVKKEEYIERIAKLLDVQQDILESLEKCNKNVLLLLTNALMRANEDAE